MRTDPRWYVLLFLLTWFSSVSHWRDLKLRGFHHDNSVTIAASPPLIGRHTFLCDNQGTTVVIEPARD